MISKALWNPPAPPPDPEHPNERRPRSKKVLVAYLDRKGLPAVREMQFRHFSEESEGWGTGWNYTTLGRLEPECVVVGWLEPESLYPQPAERNPWNLSPVSLA